MSANLSDEPLQVRESPQPEGADAPTDEHAGVNEPRRRTIRAASLAKRLRVRPELIEGLVQGKQIEGYREHGRSGRPVWLVYEDQSRKLHELMWKVGRR